MLAVDSLIFVGASCVLLGAVWFDGRVLSRRTGMMLLIGFAAYLVFLSARESKTLDHAAQPARSAPQLVGAD